MNHEPRRISMNRFYPFIIFILGFAVFSPSLSGGFLWDDEHLIVHNPNVKSLGNIPMSFTQSFFYKSRETSNITYYRPIITVINTLQYTLFGLRPFWWHLFNLVIHASNAVLFYFFMIKILNIERNLAFLAALLFGIHPVHAEAVCFISGRTDIVALFFILASLLFYFKRMARNGIYRFASIFFFILGLLSKELVLMLPMSLIAIEYVLSEESSIQAWFKKDFPPLLKSLIPYFITGAFYVLIRFLLVKGIEMPHYPTGRAITTWLTMPKVFLRYLFLTFTFHDTLCDYTNFFRIETSFFSFMVIVPVLVVLGMLIATIWLLLKKQKAFLGIFWFLIFLFPVLNIFPLGIWMAERYLYIPVVGFCLLFVSIDMKSKVRHIREYVIFMVILFGFAGSFLHSHIWRDATTLWSNAVERNPANPQARVIYAEILFARGQYDEAVKQLEQVKPIDTGAGEIFPDSLALTKMQTLVKIYTAKREYERAQSWLSAAEKIMPDSAQNAVLKGRMLLEQGNHKKAAETFEIALAINPDLFSALSGLMEVKNKLNAPPKEILILCEKAIRINPDFPLSYVYRGKAFNELGNPEKARTDFETFIRLAPDAPEGYLFLADVYEQMGRKDKSYILKAMKIYDELLSRHPDNIDGLNNLGILFAIIGEKQKAEELWKQVLVIDPKDEMARENLRKLRESPKE